jgi:hypothetical protein
LELARDGGGSADRVTEGAGLIASKLAPTLVRENQGKRSSESSPNLRQLLQR